MAFRKAWFWGEKKKQKQTETYLLTEMFQITVSLQFIEQGEVKHFSEPSLRRTHFNFLKILKLPES